MLGAIADSINVRVARLEEFVHANAVGDGEARIARELCVGSDANTDEDEIRWKCAPVGQDNFADIIFGAANFGDGLLTEDCDAVAGVKFAEKFGNNWRTYPGHDARESFDDRDLFAEHGGRGRELEPDEAAADNYYFARFG